MKLETSNAGEIINPSAVQIAAALAQLPIGEDAFAILSSEPQVYVQVAGSGQEGFVIEYREGGEDRHFEAVVPTVGLEQATEIFQRYAAGDESWQSLIGWQSPRAGSLNSSPLSIKVWLGVGLTVAVAVVLFVAAT